MVACSALLWLNHAKFLAWLDMLCLRTCLLAWLWFAFLFWLWQLDLAFTVCLICSFEYSDDSRKTRFWTLLKSLLAQIPFHCNSQLSIMILKFRRRENFNRDFHGKLGSWAWFFWRPLQEGNFEIFLEILQLHRIPNPIWFCNCKLRYTVWDIWESQLVHMRFWAILKQLFGSSSSSSSRELCEARGVVVFCFGNSLVGLLHGSLAGWLAIALLCNLRSWFFACLLFFALFGYYLPA